MTRTKLYTVMLSACLAAQACADVCTFVICHAVQQPLLPQVLMLQ